MKRLRGSRVADAIAWVAVAPFAVWLVVRLFGLERGFPLVPLMAFTPYVALASLVPVVVAIALRRWTAAGVAALVMVAFAVLVVPRALGGGGADVQDGVPLRVLSINVEYGQADPREVGRLVREFEPHVLSLQELTPAYVPRLRAEVGDSLPHALLMPSPRATGGGLLSALPLTEPTRERLPGGFALPSARLRPPGGAEVELFAVHTVPPTDWGTAGWDEDLQALPRAHGEGLRVIAGDLNATLDHAELRELIDSGYTDAGDATGGGLVATWAEERSVPPLFTIDHVLADERIGVTDYAVRTVDRTDHRAVFAELAVPPG